jgi:predicted AlkP superfamily pyrophosphatase or phosphodiesterase
MRMLFLLFMLASCQSGDHEVAAGTKPAGLVPVIHPVVLIGADGFDCSIAAPLIESGRLPHISDLVERGIIGTVSTINPTRSPIIWTTIATGVKKRKHGIRGFVVKGGKRAKKAGSQPKERKLVRSTDRKVKALWNIVGEAGRKVASVGWWVTWPVEKINGVMIAQTNIIHPQGMDAKGKIVKGTLYANHPGQVWPADLEPQIARTVGAVESTMPERIVRIFGGPFDDSFGKRWARLWKQSEWSMRADAIYHQVALDLLRDAEEPYDLFMVYFGGTDVLGHRFFRWFKPGAFEHPPSDAEVAAYGDILPLYYEELDRMVGEIIAASPADANIILVSDHGMYAWQTEAPFKGRSEDQGRFLSGHHKKGSPACLVAAGPNIADRFLAPPIEDKSPHMGTIYTVTPTILQLLGLSQAEDMPGHPNWQLISKEFKHAFPETHIPTYTPDGWVPDAVSVEEETDQEERREQLRTLGYIE